MIYDLFFLGVQGKINYFLGQSLCWKLFFCDDWGYSYPSLSTPILNIHEYLLEPKMHFTTRLQAPSARSSAWTLSFSWRTGVRRLILLGLAYWFTPIERGFGVALSF